MRLSHMAATTTPHQNEKTRPDAPGPHGLASLRTLWSFISSAGLPIPYIDEMKKQYGDVVHLNVAGRSMYAVSHPDLIQEILVKRVQEFHKTEAASDKPTALGLFLGKSILTADYDD